METNDQVLNGTAGADTLTGGPGDDVLSAGAGDDTLIGGGGEDTLAGGGGDDTLTGGPGDDVLSGGPGRDTAAFAGADAGIAADLASGTATGAGLDILSGIENLRGSAFDDTLRGDDGPNVLDGGSGNDILIGGGGNDTVIGGAGADTAFVAPGDDTIRFDDFEFGIDQIHIAADFGFTSAEAVLDTLTKPSSTVSRLTLEAGTTFEVVHDAQTGSPVSVSDISVPSLDADPPTLPAPNIGVIALSNTPQTLALEPTLFGDILGNTSGRTINLPEGAQAQGLDAGTTVNIEGPAEAFAFVRNGTTLEVRDQDTDALVTRVAVGGAVGSLRFSDGGGEITVSNAQIAFGGELFAADTRIPGSDLTLDAGLDSSGAFGATADRARPADVNLILRAQDTTPAALTIDDGIHAEILGSTGARTFNVAEGGATQDLDAGTTVNLEESADAFTFGRNGTTLEIRDSDNTLAARIAGGADSSTVRFADGATELAVDFSAGNLTFAGQSLGAGDSIAGSAADIQLDAGDTSAPFFESGSGTTSEIPLQGISGPFTDVAAFNADPSFGDITFA